VMANRPCCQGISLSCRYLGWLVFGGFSFCEFFFLVLCLEGDLLQEEEIMLLLFSLLLLSWGLSIGLLTDCTQMLGEWLTSRDLLLQWSNGSDVV